MRDLGLYIGSFLPAGVGVFQMQNFNPFTLAFWATLLGILVFSVIGGTIGMVLTETIKKKKARWNGTGQIHLKQPL